MKTEKENLIEKYGYNTGSSKWIPSGSEILQLIGTTAIFVEYNKNEKTGKFVSSFKQALIRSINDFDPVTITYEITYSLEDNPDKILKERIIPEGFSLDIAGGGIQNYMNRFIPYSLHCKCIEEGFLYDRLENLYNKRDTLPLNSLKNISISKEQEKLLTYSNNLWVVIRVENTGQILGYRIHSLTVKKDTKTKWRIFAYDSEGKNISVSFEPEETEYKLVIGKESIGTLKIIDLAE